MKISLITISYNQAKYLPSLFVSLQEQLKPRDEHIIVDANSNDNSQQLITAYAATENRCRTLFEKDRGPADGLNKGFAAATGEILAYVNADDWLLPGALQFVRQHFAENAGSEVLVGAIKLADATGRLAWRGRVADLPTAARLCTGVCQYYQQGTFFRRSVFQRTKGFNPENRTCWDREFMVDLAIAGARFHVTSRPLGAFRIHNQSITGTATNSAAYSVDSSRIRQKATEALGGAPSFYARWLALEARINPWRWIRQLRPAPVR